MTSISPTQLRAARILLEMDQKELARRAKVGIATLKRFESGTEIGEALVSALRQAAEKAGAVFIEDGAQLSGHAIGPGAALARARKNQTVGAPPKRRLGPVRTP